MIGDRVPRQMMGSQQTGQIAACTEEDDRTIWMGASAIGTVGLIPGFALGAVNLY
jgi:hypothetical protein